MISELLLPELGENITSGVIVRILVSVGEKIEDREAGDGVRGPLIAEVVGNAAEGVDRTQIGALVLRYEPKGNREVLVVRTSDPLDRLSRVGRGGAHAWKRARAVVGK